MLDFPVVLKYNVDKGKYVPLTDKLLNVIFCHFYSERTMPMAHLFNSRPHEKASSSLKKCLLYPCLRPGGQWERAESAFALYMHHTHYLHYDYHQHHHHHFWYSPHHYYRHHHHHHRRHHFVSSWQWPIPTQLHNLFDDVLRISQWLTTSHHNFKTVVLGWTSYWPN